MGTQSGSASGLSASRVPARHGLTTIAGVLGAVGALPFVVTSVQQLVGGSSRSAELAMARLGIPLDRGEQLLRFTGAVILLLSGWALLLAIAIFLRRPWARLAGILTFASYAVVAVPLTLTGLPSGSTGAPLGFAAGTAAAIAAYLLFRIEVNDDFDRAGFAQQQRRTARATRGGVPAGQ